LHGLVEKMNEDCTEVELQEILLYSSRHGDVTMVQELLSARQDNKIILDISCKGTYFWRCFYSKFICDL